MYKQLKKPKKRFRDIESAIDYCREKGFPVTIGIDDKVGRMTGEKYKIYPSGKVKHIGKYHK